VEIRAHRVGSEELFPEPGGQFRNPRGRMLTHALEDVDQIRIRVDVVQSAGHDQTLSDSDVLGTELCPTEQKILASHWHRRFILPISGRKL
jgi:hypothetical protein